MPIEMGKPIRVATVDNCSDTRANRGIDEILFVHRRFGFINFLNDSVRF